MEQNVQKLRLGLDLITKEVQNFLDQHQNQKQQLKMGNSLCLDSLPCDGTVLAQKVMKILENEEETNIKPKAVQSPETKIMSNSLIVRKILSYMDVHSLLSFRQVSRLWREEATSLLLSQQNRDRRQEFLCVTFRMFFRDEVYRHDNGATLEDFLEESSQNSQIFIYSGFNFKGGFFDLDPTLEQVFSDFSTRIQHLNLSLKYLDVQILRKILLDWTPNLKSLILDPDEFWEGLPPLKRGEDSTLFPTLFLPNLKKMTLPKIGSHFSTNSAHLIFEILTCAPNLTSIEDPKLIYVTQIISAGKLTSVQSLTWSFFTIAKRVTNLLHFVAAGPRLTSLTLGEFTGFRDSNSYLDTRIFPALLDLLELGQNTLEKVTGVEILGQHYGAQTSPHIQLQLPSFPNLTELHVRVEKTVLFAGQQILPNGHDLSKVVPNLKALHLEAEKSEVYPFTLGSAAHAGLQKLKISIFAPKLTSQNVRQWMETLGGQYPNITHLDIYIQHKGDENIPECLRLIPRHFKNLEQLIFRIWIGKNSHDQPKSEWNLDEALTGLSKETCNSLKQNYEKDPEYQKPENLDQIRTASSILDLKKLTSLTFAAQRKGRVQPIWSHVTQLYAFQPMANRQGLEVKVSGFYTSRIPWAGTELGPI